MAQRADIFFAVKVERQALEDIAKPITAEEAERDASEHEHGNGGHDLSSAELDTLRCRRSALKERDTGGRAASGAPEL